MILFSVPHKNHSGVFLLSLIIFGLERTEPFCIIHGFSLNYKYTVTADFSHCLLLYHNIGLKLSSHSQDDERQIRYGKIRSQSQDPTMCPGQFPRYMKIIYNNYLLPQFTQVSSSFLYGFQWVPCFSASWNRLGIAPLCVHPDLYSTQTLNPFLVEVFGKDSYLISVVCCPRIQLLNCLFD